MHMTPRLRPIYTLWLRQGLLLINWFTSYKHRVDCHAHCDTLPN